MSFFAGDFTVILEHGDDSGLSDAVLVTAEETLGSIVFATSGDANTAKRIGYIGKKRYVRLSIVSNVFVGGSFTIGAAVLLGNAISQPVAD
jgi:hypothetical protein